MPLARMPYAFVTTAPVNARCCQPQVTSQIASVCRPLATVNKPVIIAGTRVSVTSCSDASSTSNAPIRARNLSLTWRNGRRALDDVSLDVEAGELCMVVGPNGCGKSTLLNVIRGLSLPDEGTAHLAKPISFIRQHPDLQIVLPTVGLNCALSVPNRWELPKRAEKQLVCEALEEVGLTPSDDFYDRSSYRMSGGQRQRVVLAAALVKQPVTILFDEVTASLDPVSRASILDLVRGLVTRRHMAALWVTHLLDELDFADSIIIMDNGRIVQHGPRELMMPSILDLEEAT